jgi:hypothetical protein
MKLRESSPFLKLFCYGLMFCFGAWMVAFLYWFALRQDHDRRRAWLLSSLVWLAADAVLFSTVVVIFQHIALPSLGAKDIHNIIHNLFGSHATGLNTAENDSSSKSFSVSVTGNSASATRTRCNSSNAPPPFNAAAFVYLSHRLAMQYPRATASAIVLKHATVWPRGSHHHRGQSSDARSWVSSVFYPPLCLILSLPLLLQDAMFQLLSTVVSGAMIYVHIYLFNMFPALVVLPLYAVLCVWLVCLLRARCRRREKLNSGGAVFEVEKVMKKW